MTMNKKLREMAVFIEFIAGSGLAIFFHTVLHDTQSAYMIFGMGILLSIVTFLVREDIEQTRGGLIEQYHHIHEIPAALAQIDDPECRAKGRELIASTLKTLTLLQKGYIPLEEMEFYLEGARLSDQATRRIKAIDPLTAGGLSRGTLVNFYQSNLRALERGVSITRLFVTSREDLADPELQKVLIAQYRDSIDVRVAFRSELPASIDISGRDTSSSFDIAIFDDRAVTDAFALPGKYYGRKTGQPAEVAKYLHLYDLIEHSARPITVQNDRVVLPETAAS